MSAKFLVQWVKRGKRWPVGQETEGPFVSFDGAMNFATQDGKPANARSCVILKDAGEGINAGKFFLDFIVK